MSFAGHDLDKSGGGGFREAFARVFGDADNPMGWGVTVGAVAGIRVRLHLLFLVYAAAQILWSIPRDTFGPAYTAMAMAVLFALVLLHEFGHCFACRAVGGEADDILLWPLGGLASCAPPATPRANFITTIGGPAVNAAILPLTAAGLWAVGRQDAILFNPFAPGDALITLEGWGVVALWWTHYLNALLLAFNMLVPMFPMDAGRILHAALWARQGSRAATETTVIVGFVTALVLGAIALAGESTLLLAIAVFGAWVCWQERRRARADEEIALVGFDPGRPLSTADSPRAGRVERSEERRRQRDEAEQAELDRILARIASSGIDSLTWREKRTLRQATKRRQEG